MLSSYSNSKVEVEIEVEVKVEIEMEVRFYYSRWIGATMGIKTII
jgi:hypothetical protein